MKNALIIPAFNSLLDLPEYKTCVNTWKFYCKRYNIELHLLEGNKHYGDNIPDWAGIDFDRYLDKKFPADEYNRITFVDADTIIRWDAYNFYEFFDNNNLNIVVVEDQGGDNVAPYHYNQWKNFKPNLNLHAKYFNSGFISMKASCLQKIQEEISKYKNYYYNEKDINCHPVGIGKEGGVRLDAPSQTPINIILQEFYSNEIYFAPSIFNLQLSYYYNSWEEFFNNCEKLEFLNSAMIYHLGGVILAQKNLATNFWNLFKNNYQL